jgi:hypothetical protein
MYERFTDRARKVMQLANQEAQRFNHEYIGTEHILLGLVKEGSGTAATALKDLGIDLRKIRLEVEKRVQSGPDAVIMGKLPHTPRAKKVIEYSIEEARKLGHNYVGTEHLLLGLLKEGEGIASQILNNLGATLEAIENSEAIASDRLSPEIRAKLAMLQMEKEKAIWEQDFQKAVEYRDKIDEIKRRQNVEEVEQDADPQAEEALHLITCVLLSHMLDDKSAVETLVEIMKIIGEL